MADVKVSAFTAAAALAPGDLVPVIQSLANRAATASQFTDFLLSSTNLARTGSGVLTLNTTGASTITFPLTGTLVGSSDVGTVTSTMMATTGVTAGSYTNTNLTVDAQGRITAASNGSSGSPGGSTTQVQFNNAGAFAGDADFTYNSTTNVLTVGGEVVTNGVQASTSGGGHLQTNGGADCILFGAGGSANGTLYGGWNYDSGTADRILSLNSGKTITALDTATYPSLIELAHVKGVTSAIQTQLNARATASFTTIAVSGQSDVVADSASDTLTLVAGSNITITTNAGTDTITISASGGGGSISEYYTFSFDGGGALPNIAVLAHARIPRTGTIQSWAVTAYDRDGVAISGSAVVDLWKDTTANYPPTVADTITASAKPTLTTANIATSSTLTGWTTSVAAGDWIFAKLDSVSGTNVSKIVLRLEVQH